MVFFSEKLVFKISKKMVHQLHFSSKMLLLLLVYLSLPVLNDSGSKEIILMSSG